MNEVTDFKATERGKDGEEYVDDTKSFSGQKRPRTETNDTNDATDRANKTKTIAHNSTQVVGRKKKNTAVFVSGLPEDTTVDELAEYFGKYGVIMDDMFTGGPRIKLYERDDDSFKGEALIVYLREESAQMAVEYLDDSPFRFNVSIRVSPAHFSEEDNNNSNISPEGKSNEAGSRARGLAIDKQRWKQHMQQMQHKLEWTVTGLTLEEESQLAAQRRRLARFARMVVLQGMFTEEEVQSESSPELFRLDLEREVQEECEHRLGPVASVRVLLAKQRVIVKFREAETAQAAIQLMNGRKFSGHRVSASLYDGSFSIKESATRHEVDETRPDEERLGKFGEWLEEQSPLEEEDEEEA